MKFGRSLPEPARKLIGVKSAESLSPNLDARPWTSALLLTYKA